MKKRGLSTIVITLIIILISLVAVGIIWVVVRNVIQIGTKEVTIGQFTLDAKIKDVNVYNFSNNVSLTLKRNPGVGEFNKMNFVFSDGKSSEVITQPVSLNELEEKWFMFHLGTINVSNLISISIFPYVKQDEKEILGNILDKYTVSTQTSIIPICTPLINNYCSIQGYVCGSWGNGSCFGNLNCGACGGATPVCNSSGRCVASCTPLINNYCSIQGYECGYWGNNSCSGNLSCGTCGSGFNCNATGRCVLNISGNIINALSCSYADVSNAINSANSGDTVMVPAGSCTWTNPLIITKGIKLQGAGINSTNIQAGFSDAYNGVISYKPDSTERIENNMMRITGFTINGVGSQNGIYVENSPSLPLHVVDKIRIDHNKIINAGRAVYINGAVYGVADNNIVENCGHGMDGEGTGSTLEWANLPRQFGNADNFYFEDNTFIGNFVYHAGGHGGRYIARYNTYNMSIQENLLPALDMHGNQYAGYGMMINEVYGNKFNMKYYNNGNYLIDQRGSWVLGFWNQVNTNTATINHYIRIREEFGDSWSNSPPGNPGTYTMHANNSYFWNNRHVTYTNYILSAPDMGEECCNSNPGYGQDPACCYNEGGTLGISEGYDWFNQNILYNGITQTGVYCGNTLPSNCVVGDGAWITTQDCTTVSDNNVGVNPTTPISGTFYKCTAPNTWTFYYTPYTYPHPLRLI